MDLDSVNIKVEASNNKVNVDKDSRKFSFQMSGLAAGESKDAFVTANIFATAALPASNTNCSVNFAEAKAEGTGTASDTSQYCVRKEVLGVTTVPKTGASEVVLLGLGGMAVVGFSLRKKSLI